MFTHITRLLCTHSVPHRPSPPGHKDPGAAVTRAGGLAAPKGEAPWLEQVEVWQERHSWWQLGEATVSPSAPGRSCGRVSWCGRAFREGTGNWSRPPGSQGPSWSEGTPPWSWAAPPANKAREINGWKSAFYIGGWLHWLAASSFQTSMLKAGRRHGCGNVILNKCFAWEYAGNHVSTGYLATTFIRVLVVDMALMGRQWFCSWPVMWWLSK